MDVIITDNVNDIVKIKFLKQTTLSGTNFLGIVDLPEDKLDSTCSEDIVSTNEKLESCVSIGTQQFISVSKPVRIVLTGEGEHIPFFATNDNSQRTEISTLCTSDDMNSVSQLIGASGQPEMCYIKVNNDMIIWTSHFTIFGTFSIPNSNDESTSSSSSSGDRPPPKIDGIGLFKIIDGDTETSVESQNFEKYFPYILETMGPDGKRLVIRRGFIQVPPTRGVIRYRLKKMRVTDKIDNSTSLKYITKWSKGTKKWIKT